MGIKIINALIEKMTEKEVTSLDNQGNSALVYLLKGKHSDAIKKKIAKTLMDKGVDYKAAQEQLASHLDQAIAKSEHKICVQIIKSGIDFTPYRDRLRQLKNEKIEKQIEKAEARTHKKSR